MRHINIGIIADDFTGASDAASFLVKGGNKTVLLTEIPESFDYDCDSVVVATKVRSVDPEEAINTVSKVIDFFEKISVEKIYFKYCSTFDSTPKGNIGVIMDYLLERTDTKYSILCPSLPVNGRQVKDGILYVNGIPLAESTMKNHPLNPMWDSYIPSLMKEQSKYPCYTVTKEEIKNSASHIKDDKHYYLIPDYFDDEDGKMISEAFKDLKLLSGGSGLLEHLFKNQEKLDTTNDFDLDKQKAVIVCGSCSSMTNKQVQTYKNSGYPSYALDSREVLSERITAKQLQKIADDNQPMTTLIYSDGCEGNLRRESNSFLMESSAIEEILSDLALNCRNDGYNKIVVAGGETSGAVTIKLGYSAFYVGESVAPGVPVLTPLENTGIRIILKSGNFGDEKFFIKILGAK